MAGPGSTFGESLAEGLFPRTVAAAYANLPRRVLAGTLDAASLPGRTYSALWHRYDEPMLQNMARTGATPGSSLAAGVAESMARDPLTLLSAPVGGLAGSGGRALASGIGSALLRRAAPVAADAAANAGLSALAQYGTEGRVDPGVLAANAGLGIGMQGLGSAAAKMSQEIPGGGKIFDKWLAGSEKGVLPAYHGSPNKFDVFDLDKVGSQRATTEGWGAYYATDQKNAKRFGKIANVLGVDPDDAKRFISWEDPFSQQTDYVKSALSPVVDAMRAPSAEDIKSAAVAFAKDKINADVLRKYPGLHKYQWSPEDYSKYIESLRDQPIYRSLSKITKGESDPKGRDIYASAVSQFNNSNKNASKYLGDYGASGMIFPSGYDLHSVVRESPNLLIWDQDLLERSARPNSASFVGGGQSPIAGANALAGRYFRGLLNQNQANKDQ